MNTSRESVDVAVVGAGIAGIVGAQQLRQAGYRVVVLEKSRGVGGRVATRRLSSACADHGLRYFEEQGPFSRVWLPKLLEQGVITPWGQSIQPIHSLEAPGLPAPNPSILPRYCAPAGATAAAKSLSTGLEIWRGQRVVALAPTENHWTFTLECLDPVPKPPLIAGAVMMAIPAPQAEVLLKPLTEQGLPTELFAAVAAVEFDPCIAVIATYRPNPSNASPLLCGWESAIEANEAGIAWIGLETSKRAAESPVVVLQSTAEFAQSYLDAPDLQEVGELLLNRAAEVALPWLRSPEQLQVHRWRYARVRRPGSQRYLLTALPLPLVCCGDWCGGSQIEAALQSGFAAAHALQAQLNGTAAPSDAEQISRFEQLLKAIA